MAGISEKDKKLLIFLAIFLVVFGLIYFLIMPMYEQNRDLAKKIQEEEYTRQEYESKTKMLVAMELIALENEETLLEAGKMFYPIMTTTQIDNLITSQVMEYDLTAKDLDIKRMTGEDNTVLLPYKTAQDEEEEEEDEEDAVGGPYTGLYTARVSLAVTGSHRDLQRFLDANINAGVKQRVVSYLWSSQDSGVFGLSMSLELYMCEDIEAFLASLSEDEEEGEEADEPR